ncbi:hypothetical protein LM604_01705, partial [Candidatus Acetothermia bacterium]|nr:hypothetical protein [Candidatus Acetothermia bacterium]
VLSGGQSLEVGLRFDPTGSGSFNVTTQLSLSGTCVRWSEEVLDGRSQCLEQSVAQGSVSVALAGVAHKISIEPTGLDFGIVFLGSFSDRKLTIKNEGTTNVTLESTVTYPENPFQITAPLDSLVLSPNQSAEVMIRFRPTGSGAYTGNVGLLIGSVMRDIPVRARAYTYEEYLELKKETLRAACEADAYPIRYAEQFNQGKGLIVSGCSELTEEEILARFEELASQGLTALPPQIAQALDILQNIGEEQIKVWIWTLVLAERQDRFEQEYERLLNQGFDQYVNAIRLILDVTTEQIKPYIHEHVQALASTNAQDLESALQIYLETNPFDPIWRLAYEIYVSLDPYSAFFLAYRFYSVFGQALYKYLLLFSGSGESGFRADIETILRHINVKPTPQEKAYLMERFLAVLSEIARGNKEAIAIIQVAANSLHHVYGGWQIVDFYKSIMGTDPITGQPKQYFIDLVLVHRSYYLQSERRYVQVLALTNFYSCSVCGNNDWHTRDMILAEIDAIMKNLDLLRRQYQVNNGGSDLILIGMVFIVQGADGISDIIAKIEQRYSNKDVAIFVTWVDGKSRIWYACIGQACSRLTDEQKRQEACRQMGAGPNCGARDWNGLDPIDKKDIHSIGAPAIVMPYKDPFDVDPWVYTREWLCSMSRGQAARYDLEALWDILCQ